MSVPYIDSAHWVPLAVLAASLAGSGHCVSMCGGLVFASSRTRLGWLAYQLGRLIGYLALGAVAGFVGSQVLEADSQAASWMSWLSTGAALLLGLSFVLAGLRIWRGGSLHVSVVPKPILMLLYRRVGKNPWLNGALSALLPCGWLHSFVLGAVATRSSVQGAVFLGIFWLGTLPALGLAPWLFGKVFNPLALRSPKVAAVILFVVGAVSIGMKVMPTGHCH